VVPTRNRAVLLRKALRSVLAQEDVDLQVVVVDDGSTDGTASLLANVSDPRVQVVHQSSRRGVSEARNAGIAACDAQWIAFIDDDDLWAPDKLISQVRAFEERPDASWGYVGSVFVNFDLHIIGRTEALPCPDIAVEIVVQDVVPGGGSGVMVASHLLQTVGGFDPVLSIRADWDMWLRLAQHSPVVAVNGPLIAYRAHRGGMSLDVAGCAREFDAICAKHADLQAAHDVVPDRVVEDEWHAHMYLRAGQRRRSLQKLWAVARAQPSRARLGRSAVMAFMPGAVRIREHRGNRSVPPAWRLEAEAWLAPFR